jgi:hypothetical protein
MTLPPFPSDALDLSDYDLGGLLIGWFVMTQAYDLDLPIDHIPDEFAERVRQYVLTQEAETAKNAAIEKALHKAASGDFESAGRFLREYLKCGAVSLKYIPIGVKFTRGRKKNTGSPIRKAIAKLLKANPAMRNPELWEAIKIKPPKGWVVYESVKLGKYIEGPKLENISHRRFCNICGEERKKITG